MFVILACQVYKYRLSIRLEELYKSREGETSLVKDFDINSITGLSEHEAAQKLKEEGL